MAIEPDVESYYERPMPYLLADIGARPIYFLRPDPQRPGAFAYERHPLPGLERVHTVHIVNSKGALAEFAVVTDEAGVRELLEIGAVEFHPWGCLANDVEHADRVVFDVDPGERVSMAQVKEAALDLRSALEAEGLRSFLRTSGRKGFHVVAPLRPGRLWSEVRSFTRGIAETLERRFPHRYVSKASLNLRPGKVFVDYLRNGRGTTAAGTYSLRAAPGWPAALPLRWEELEALPAPDAFPATVARQRLGRGYVDPWADFDVIQQTLP